MTEDEMKALEIDLLLKALKREDDRAVIAIMTTALLRPIKPTPTETIDTGEK